MTLNTESDLDGVKMNQYAKYLGQRPFISLESYCPDAGTHTLDQLFYPASTVVGKILQNSARKFLIVSVTRI